MALLTIPATPEKGNSQEYILNVTDLIALVSEAYFQDQLNWSKVVLVYQSSVSNQLEVINFIPDGVSTSISEMAEFSLFARDLFEVNSITIFDKQNGRYIIKASQIPDVANYSIDFAAAPVGNYINYNLLNGGITTNAFGAVICPPGNPGNTAKASTINYANSDYTFTFEIAPTLTYGFFCGISTSINDGLDANSFGFASYGASNTICAYQFNSPVAGDITLLPSGNVARLEKIGVNRYFYVNNVLIHTLLGTQPTAEYPTVRPYSDTPVTASLVVTPPPVSSAFSPTLKSTDITLSNGNLTAKRTSSAVGPYVSALIDNAFLLSSTQKIYIEFTADSMATSSLQSMGFVFQTGVPSSFNDASVTIPGFYGVQGPRVVWQGNSLYQQPTGGMASAIAFMGEIITGNVVGIAIDLQSQTFSFNNNGVFSSDFSYSGLIGSADRLYFAVGPYTSTTGSEDTFTKNTSSIYTPSGYTLI